MEYLRKVDLSALSEPGRVDQMLVNEESDAPVRVTWIKTPPGDGSPAGLHTHPFDQIFYLLSGTMSLEIDGKPYEADGGTLILFPEGVPHKNWNAGSEPTVHLAINGPKSDPDAPFAQTISS